MRHITFGYFHLVMNFLFYFYHYHLLLRQEAARDKNRNVKATVQYKQAIKEVVQEEHTYIIH